MNDREIFDKALEILDPLERQEFLITACGGGSEQLARISRLLENEPLTNGFLEKPAWDDMQLSLGDKKISDLLAKRFGNDESVVESTFETERLDLSFLSPTNHPDCLGELMQYRIESLIGHGGFGIVLKAHDTQLQRTVAVKAMHPILAATSPPRKRFLREARAAAKVSHENVVRIYAVEEKPIPFLVMEYIDGHTLQQKLRESGPLSTYDLVSVARQIAHGINAAHSLGLIHRDIKPANILIEADVDRSVKLTDFGLARTKDEAAITHSGTVSGTPLYMAPEQFMGLPIDERSDQFSLGSVLYELACGHPPFRAPNLLSVMRRVAEDNPRSLRELYPDLPAWLEAIIFKLLEKKPDNRFDSIYTVCKILDLCKEQLDQGSDVVEAIRPLVPELSHVEESFSSKTRGNRKWQYLPSVLGLAVLFALLLLGRVLWHQSPQSDHLITDPIQIASESGLQVNDNAIEKESTPVRSEPIADKVVPFDLKSPPLPSLPNGMALRSPFSANQAREAQIAWANYLGIPLETDGAHGITLVLVPPGEFLMGLDPSDAEKFISDPNNYDDQKNLARGSLIQHWVRISEPFYVSKFEISEKELVAVLGLETNFRADLDLENSPAPKRGDSEDLPAVRVSWEEATAFCEKLSEHDDPILKKTRSPQTEPFRMVYRLPTEAEWEWSARAGALGKAADPLADPPQGWFLHNSGGRVRARGQLPPNAFGLHDMLGNVQEWCYDYFDPRVYSKRFADATISIDPVQLVTEPTEPGARVHRGGAVVFGAFMGSAAYRNFRPRYSGSWFTGFRIIKTIPRPQGP